MSQIDVNSLLNQMRSLSSQMDAVRGDAPTRTDAIGGAGVTGQTGQTTDSFGSLLKQSIESINEAQGEAKQMQNAFERGDNTNLAQVMVSAQKADLSFRTMVQVRNKLVDAYKDIMNMQV
ncbi:flagellar hook-basal body complex protein FliE [Oleiagrimonas sp. C23AA]|uniref:flagellar hook-basal body complex protein FliE n=1 Tax=Oleiagrimonas sp. C23AA TaxID=2719047 RepID=UPI00141EB33B|nr:flagellar hook-basal body complex protein FliE [Oleiagrimonas sp. C23AA]NII09195.1 flagellar hook-basal body complex protein FliE [Oleiagrimonas sp. C23AA]